MATHGLLKAPARSPYLSQTTSQVSGPYQQVNMPNGAFGENIARGMGHLAFGLGAFAKDMEKIEEEKTVLDLSKRRQAWQEKARAFEMDVRTNMQGQAALGGPDAPSSVDRYRQFIDEGYAEFTQGLEGRALIAAQEMYGKMSSPFLDSGANWYIAQSSVAKQEQLDSVVASLNTMAMDISVSEADLQRQLEQVLNQEIPLFASGRDIEALRIQTQEKVKQLRFEANLAQIQTQAQNGDTAGKNAVSSNIQPERSELISPLANATLTQLNGSRTPYMQLAQANTGSRTDVGGGGTAHQNTDNWERARIAGTIPLTDARRSELEERWLAMPEAMSRRGDENEVLPWIHGQYATLAKQVESDTGRDAALLLAMTFRESRGDPRSTNPRSSALGLTHMTKRAVEDVASVRGYNNKAEIEALKTHRVDPEQNYYMTDEYLTICQRAVRITDDRLTLLGYYKGAYGVGDKVDQYVNNLLKDSLCARLGRDPEERDFKPARTEWIANMSEQQKETLVEAVMSQYDASARQYVEDIFRRRDQFRDM